MFRTTEISDPRFECNNLRFLTVKTANLLGRGDICVFVPPVKDLTGVPLLILLHGVYGSAWCWSQQGGVHLTAANMMAQQKIGPMIIAMPSDGLWGDGSGYLRHNGYDFERWIVEDVPNAIQENITDVSPKTGIFIAGLSMGGFGALRLGIKHSGTFSGISAHSAITEIAQMESFVEEDWSVFKPDENQASILDLIDKHPHQVPPLRFDCGTEDELLGYNRKLHSYLTDIGVPHEYREFPGGHDWNYWHKHVRDTLLFVNSVAYRRKS